MTTPSDVSIFQAHMPKVIAVGEGKRNLLAANRRSGIMRCPCGAEGRTLRIVIAGTRNHAHASCKACGFGLMK